jgi:drug/metabolite transporter, DME family
MSKERALESKTGLAASGRGFVVAAALLFSVGGVITKGLDLRPLSIAIFRSLFAGLAMLVFVPRRNWVIRRELVPLGIVFGALIGLYIAAVKATTAANAIFLQATSTFWVVPLGLILLRERPDRRSLLGIGLGTLGVVAIVGSGTELRPGEGIGIALGLASGFASALVMVGARRLRDLDPVWMSAVLNLVGAATLCAWVFVSGEHLTIPTAGQSLALAGFGVIQMAIPWALLARGLRDVPAAEAGLISLLEPALNPVWVALVHREYPSGPTLIGGAFLLTGVAVRYWPIRPRSSLHGGD